MRACRYSPDHVEIRAPVGTIVAFQNGVWHRALPLGLGAVGRPRSIVYFGYSPCMLRPLHRPLPCESIHPNPAQPHAHVSRTPTPPTFSQQCLDDVAVVLCGAVRWCADGGDADALGLTAEERWLLHEDKPPTGWVYGSARDHVRAPT